MHPYIENFKASDVQDTNEVLSGLLGIQLLVNTNHHPQEHLFINRFCKSTHIIVHLERQDNGSIYHTQEMKKFQKIVTAVIDSLNNQ